MDDYSSEIRMIDDSNNEIWYCQLLNFKFKCVREGQYVRIRSATLEHHEKYNEQRSFGLKQYSNILSLPSPSLLAENMKLTDVSERVLELESSLLK